jgi:hypothetical protein
MPCPEVLLYTACLVRPDKFLVGVCLRIYQTLTSLFIGYNIFHKFRIDEMNTRKLVTVSFYCSIIT